MVQGTLLAAHYGMENKNVQARQNEPDKSRRNFEDVIPVIQEQAVISSEVIETGKVHIRKKVTEQTETVNLPIINESYHIEHVPVEHKVYDTPPPAVRHEGDKMVVTVLREVSVVQKKYEVIEEIHITRQFTETPLVQEITLLKEQIDIERSSNNRK
jgi:stress response protein YsnF